MKKLTLLLLMASSTAFANETMELRHAAVDNRVSVSVSGTGLTSTVTLTV